MLISFLLEKLKLRFATEGAARHESLQVEVWTVSHHLPCPTVHFLYRDYCIYYFCFSQKITNTHVSSIWRQRTYIHVLIRWGDIYCITAAPPATADRKVAVFFLCCCWSLIDFLVLVRPMFPQKSNFVFSFFFSSQSECDRMWQWDQLRFALLRMWQPSTCDLKKSAAERALNFLGISGILFRYLFYTYFYFSADFWLFSLTQSLDCPFTLIRFHNCGWTSDDQRVASGWKQTPQMHDNALPSLGLGVPPATTWRA